MPERIANTSEGLLAAVSAGAVGGLAALGIWELTAAPGVVAALSAGAAGAAVHLAGDLTDRLLDRTSVD